MSKFSFPDKNESKYSREVYPKNKPIMKFKEQKAEINLVYRFYRRHVRTLTNVKSAWKCILQKNDSEKNEVSLYAFFTGWLSKTCGQLAKKCYKTNDMSECIFHTRKFSKKHGILLSLESWVTILKEYSKHICILDIASVASLQSAKTQFSRFLLNKVHKAMCASSSSCEETFYTRDGRLRSTRKVVRLH